MSAAFAASSIAFRNVDKAYAQGLLDTAAALYLTAQKHPGLCVPLCRLRFIFLRGLWVQTLNLKTQYPVFCSWIPSAFLCPKTLRICKVQSGRMQFWSNVGYTARTQTQPVHCRFWPE